MCYDVVISIYASGFAATYVYTDDSILPFLATTESTISMNTVRYTCSKIHNHLPKLGMKKEVA